MIAFCAEWVPLWNPMNVCSYHLQEAGATPTQELAYSLATAIGVLDAVKESGQVAEDRFPQVFASISFFVNSGIRFVEETARCGPSPSCGTASASSATASPTRRPAASATACR